MTLAEIKARVMFQTNNDKEDIGDFSPYILGYINEGYNILLADCLGVHAGDTDYPLLKKDDDEPVSGIPEWAHGAIADYATYRIYTNGNAPKQSRGASFLYNFRDQKGLLKKSGASTVIYNIPQ